VQQGGISEPSFACIEGQHSSKPEELPNSILFREIVAEDGRFGRRV